MNNSRNKTDYELIAELYRVTPAAVRKAIQRREIYPHSKFVTAYDKLQKGKLKTLKTLAA